MKIKIHVMAICILLGCIPLKEAAGQNTDSTWTLQKCIQYALQQNIQVRKTGLVTETAQVNEDLAREARFPSLSASIGQNFSWARTQNVNSYGSYSGSNGTSYGVNSGMTLYNGGKLRKNIKQSELSYQASQYDTETTKESISLSVLNAYLQVLYAREQVKNSQQQVEVTAEQLRLAEERVRLGAISQSDYLQVKSQLASEKLTLANAENLLAVDKVTLMQLLELPASANFSIMYPVFGDSINENRNPVPDSIFNIAMGIKPQIKSADLAQQSAKLDVDIARADMIPKLSLSGDITTGYSSLYSGMAYDYQVQNRITPSVGLTLSIPIYQNKQIRSNVAIAKIGEITAELNASDTKNQLRKAIEQSCVDVVSAERKYEASLESYNAASESHEVAFAKFNQGLLSSIDYLLQKTNLIVAQSALLQAKFNLIFNYKTLDFYKGVPLSL